MLPSLSHEQPKNGRIDIITPNTDVLFSMYDKIPAHQTVTMRDALTGIWEETVLSKVFFSPQNLQIIQNKIRAEIYNMSNGKYIIPEQDTDTLRIIMRSMYLQHATHLPSEIRNQVAALNDMVYDYVIPKVFTEVQGYMNYKRDVSNMYTPIARPDFSQYKFKTIEYKTFF